MTGSPYPHATVAELDASAAQSRAQSPRQGAGRLWSQADRERIRRLVAEGRTAREIGAIYGEDRLAIIGMVWRNDLGPWPKQQPAPIPEDFAERWKTSSQAVLVEHYGKSIATISRWCKEARLTRAAPSNFRSAAKAAKPKPAPQRNKRASVHAIGQPSQSFSGYARDTSRVGRAVEYLQRFGAVSRCDENGVLRTDGKFWRRGSSILTDDDIIERADSMRDREALRARSAGLASTYL